MPVHVRKFDLKLFSIWFLGRTLGFIILESYFIAIGTWVLFLWYLKLYRDKS